MEALQAGATGQMEKPSPTQFRTLEEVSNTIIEKEKSPFALLEGVGFPAGAHRFDDGRPALGRSDLRCGELPET